LSCVPVLGPTDVIARLGRHDDEVKDELVKDGFKEKASAEATKAKRETTRNLITKGKKGG